MSKTSNRPIRVLVVKVTATALRDAGIEVIDTGLRQTPEMVVNRTSFLKMTR